ncbi:MAG: radical SAM protein, partial [Bdellovibrionales bacterium]|nr:radical SAM protein [Bdellovibrionales bacterium]
MPLDLLSQSTSTPGKRWNFEQTLGEHRLSLPPLAIDTLQVNITKLCNQACRHCHVDAGPKRTESMSRELVEHCLDVLGASPAIRTLDITGGAPELHPDFGYLVDRAQALGKHVIARHNLTVTMDPHPITGVSMRHLPEFYATRKVELISSLPFYDEYFTDKQRG